MTGSPLRDTYYQRIGPVVGQSLLGRVVAVPDPELLVSAVDALARSGVLRWRFAPGPVVAEGSLLAVTLGPRWIGLHAGEALRAHLLEHNRWEDRWEVRVEADPLADRDVELVLGGRLTTLEAATRRGLPGVAACLLQRGAALAVLTCHPVRAPLSASLAEQLAPALTAKPEAPARRFDLLDANDLAAALARALLLQGTGREPRDLLDRTLTAGRPLVVRGSPAWPWEVAYGGPSELNRLAGLLERPWPRPALEALLARVLRPLRLLLVGCGTASNWLPEILSRFGELCLVDAKPFSVYNPVRQLVRTDLVGQTPKPLAVLEELRLRGHPAETLAAIRPAVLHPTLEDPPSVAAFQELLDTFRPNVAVVGTGRSGLADDFLVARELRRRGIPHLVSTAFPGVSHYKHIFVDGWQGPAYDALQQRLPIDRGAGPTLDEEARQLFYGGTQPATLVETLPSVHSGLRLLEQLALPHGLRAPWFSRLAAARRTCLVGANRVEARDGGPLYGVSLPFQVVAYGEEDIVAG